MCVGLRFPVHHVYQLRQGNRLKAKVVNNGSIAIIGDVLVLNRLFVFACQLFQIHISN